MHVVMVPLVSADTAVGSALDILRRQERAGVVVRDSYPESYRLLYAGDLLRARAANTMTVDQVAGARPVLLLDSRLADVFGLDLVRPVATGPSYERLLLERGFEYALAGESDESAMIVTMHERQRDTLLGTGGYECDGQPRHYFPEPRVRLGDACPLTPHSGSATIQLA